MEIDKTIRAFGKCLKKIEKRFGYPLKEWDGKTSASRRRIEQLCTEPTIKEFFKRKKRESQSRHVHALLFYNTEFEIKDELESCPDFGHTIGIIPALNVSVYFALCHDHGLIQYTLALIEKAPAHLATEILYTINAEHGSLPVDNRFAMLADALYALFARFQRTDAVDGPIPKSLYDGFNLLLVPFKDDNDDGDDDHENENEKIKGYKWMSLLRLLKSATINRFGDEAKRDDCSRDVVPLVSNNSFLMADQERCGKCDESDEEIARECYEKIYYLCTNIGCALDVNVFVAWHEIQCGDVENTLQNAVGEEAYHLRECLETYSEDVRLPPTDVQLLLAIARSVQVQPPPPSIEEKRFVARESKPAAAVTLDQIVERITRPDDDLVSANFLNDLAYFLNTSTNERFEFEICRKVVRRLCDDQRMLRNESGQRCSLVKDIVLRLIRRLNVDEIAFFVGEFVQNYGTNHFLYERLQSSDAADFVIVRLDIINEEDDEDTNQALKDILIRALRSTNEVLSILIKQACTESGCTPNILKVFRKMKKTCLSHPASSSFSRRPSTIPVKHLPLLVSVMDNFLQTEFIRLNRAEKFGFFDLISSLLANQLVDISILCEECLLPLMNVKNDTDWDAMADLVTLLEKSFHHLNTAISKFTHLRILIHLAGVLEKARWRMATFTTAKLRACEATIEVVELLRKKVYRQSPTSDNDGDKVYENLSKELRSFSALTKCYFVDDEDDDDDDVSWRARVERNVEHQIIRLIKKPIADHSAFVNELDHKKALFVSCLGKILPLCTLREIENIIQNFTNGETNRLILFLDTITNGVSFIVGCASQFSATISEADTNRVYLCLGYTINNLFTLLLKHVGNAKEPAEIVQFFKYANRICATLHHFPTSLIRTYEFNAIKFIVDMLEMLKSNDHLQTKMNETKASHDQKTDSQKLLLGLFLL